MEPDGAGLGHARAWAWAEPHHSVPLRPSAAVDNLGGPTMAACSAEVPGQLTVMAARALKPSTHCINAVVAHLWGVFHATQGPDACSDPHKSVRVQAVNATPWLMPVTVS